MRINEEGLEIVKRFEGLRLGSYTCPAGIWTVGYGSTGPDVREGMKITEDEADEMLSRDLRKFERCVEGMLSVPITPNQFSALVSLTFNIGCDAFRRSTLRAYVNRKAWKEAALEFAKWNKGGGRVLAGLTARRAEEARLFTRAGEELPWHA